MSFLHVFASVIVAAMLLGGCQAASSKAYDDAISCVSATDAMIAAARTAGDSPAAYERVRTAWLAKAVAEGKLLGRDESDTRAALAERLEARLRAMRSSKGEPDSDRILIDLKRQNEQLQHCRTPA